MKEELQSVISNWSYQLLEGEPIWRQVGRCDTDTRIAKRNQCLQSLFLEYLAKSW